MIMGRIPVCATLLMVFAMVSACTSEDENTISVDAVRQAAGVSDPAQCPIAFDVGAAVKSAGVDGTAELASADAEVSASTTPAADPLGAQQNGMSALDAAAGAYVECDYRLGTGTVAVRLVATRAKAAVNLLAPQIVREAGLRIADLEPLVASPPGPGEVKIAGGTVAVSGVAAEGGDAALMVSSSVPELHDDTLRAVTGTLVEQIRF